MPKNISINMAKKGMSAAEGRAAEIEYARELAGREAVGRKVELEITAGLKEYEKYKYRTPKAISKDKSLKGELFKIAKTMVKICNQIGVIWKSTGEKMDPYFATLRNFWVEVYNNKGNLPWVRFGEFKKKILAEDFDYLKKTERKLIKKPHFV